jgi:hypothetical protein
VRSGRPCWREGGDAVLADCEGHRAECTQGCGLHNEAQDLEHHAGEALNRIKDGRSDFAHGIHGDAEDYGDEDNLKDVAFNEGTRDAGPDDVGQELPPLLVRAGVDQFGRRIGGFQRARISVDPVAGGTG